MGKAVAIRYELTVEDLVGFSLFHLQTSPARKRSSRIGYGFIFLCVLTTLFFRRGDHFSDPRYWMIFIPVLCVVGFLFVFLYSRWRTWLIKRSVRRIYNEGDNPGLVGRHKLTVNDRGVWEETEVGESRTNWEGIVKILSSGTHTFIYIGAAQAHVVPKASIVEGDYDAFVAQAKDWLAQKRPSLQEA